MKSKFLLVILGHAWQLNMLKKGRGCENKRGGEISGGERAEAARWNGGIEQEDQASAEGTEMLVKRLKHTVENIIEGNVQCDQSFNSLIFFSVDWRWNKISVI